MESVALLPKSIGIGIDTPPRVDTFHALALS